MMNIFVLDTNLFFNLQSGLQWGKTSKEVIEQFTQYALNLIRQKKACFYMTPGVIEEFKSFFDEQPSFVDVFFTTITIKSPDVTRSVVGADILRDFVEEARERSYRGMKIAEEEIIEATKSMVDTKILSLVEQQKKTGALITKFRQRYRHATRFNFIDSGSDLELILLALEVHGAIVSADEGVMRWGRMMGVKEVSPLQFRSSLEAL